MPKTPKNKIHRFNVRMNPDDLKPWGDQARADGFGSVGAWMRWLAQARVDGKAKVAR